jgi:broad specificity phosphatase PhoE
MQYHVYGERVDDTMDRKQIERAEKIAQKLEARRLNGTAVQHSDSKSSTKTPRHSAAELRQTQDYHDEMQRRKSARNINPSQFGGV